MGTKKKRNAGKGSTRSGPLPFDLKLRAVKLYLEEGYTRDMVAEERGM